MGELKRYDLEYSGETLELQEASGGDWVAWDDVKDLVALGREMQAALDRGRELHPWEGEKAQLAAVVDEAWELLDACTMGQDKSATYGEARDAWVCARRLIEGK